MHFLMNFNRTLITERFIANTATVLSLPTMYVLMYDKTIFVREFLFTYITAVWL
jgi:hypothetical protein